MVLVFGIQYDQYHVGRGTQATSIEVALVVRVSV